MRCDTCGRRLRQERRDYPYTESGLKIVLTNARVYVCPDHGVQAAALPVAALQETIAQALLHLREPLWGAAVQFLRKHRGWTQAELARRLGVHQVTVARWETDTGPVPLANQQRLRLLFADPEAFAASQVTGRPRREARRPVLRIPWPAGRALAGVPV
jgi:putative zinc finger/helix-turn-helix YgiT family protein